MTEEICHTSLRIQKNVLALTSSVAKSRSETVSTFIRRAILKELASLSYLDADQKKALGVKSER